MNRYPFAYMFGLSDFSNGGWYDPTPEEKIGDIIKLLRIQSKDSAVDIGSGDGRLVIAMAQAGARATGIEKDPKLVKLSQQRIRDAHLNDKAAIINADFWQQDFSIYNKIVIFQFKTVMEKLEQKLIQELPRQSLVVCNYWQFPNWQPVKRRGELFLYQT